MSPSQAFACAYISMHVNTQSSIGVARSCRMADGTAEFIDAREVAPAAANETMFVGK